MAYQPPVVEPIETLEHDAPQLAYRPLLGDFLREVSPLPPYSLVVGLCEDGLPLLFDLTEPSPGCFLLVSDSPEFVEDALHSLMTSGLRLNSEAEVAVHLLAQNAEKYSSLFKEPGFRVCLSPGQPETAIFIEELINLVEERRSGKPIAPIHVVCIEELDTLLRASDEHIRQSLDWLIEAGPHFGVWVFAGLEGHKYFQRPSGSASRFASRILGRVSSHQEAAHLAGEPAAPMLSQLGEGEGFVQVRGELIKVIIPFADGLRR